MTAYEHRRKHYELHAALDELIACYLTQEWYDKALHAPLLSQTTLMEFLLWSGRQLTEAPALGATKGVDAGI